ncbi:MAG: tyrosine-protein phosphatase [Oligoflexia bacterium]|nr:tyrosine-protein phosphatase [Oligoflexia bacterium]
MKKSLSFILLLSMYLLTYVYAYAGIKNFGTVMEGIYRGGQIRNFAEYQMLADLGVNSIINLEYAHRDNSAACNELNFDCQKYGILLTVPRSDRYFNYRMLQAAFKATINAKTRGEIIYIHCYRGKDRTGALASAIMIREATCGKEYDKKALKKEIDDTLKYYGFKESIYPYLHRQIISWTQNPPAWMCN